MNRSVFFTLLTICLSFDALAKVQPARIFGSNMVLQRELNFPVWGKASPNEKIEVSLSEYTIQGAADEDGNWKIVMPQMKAGGPYQLKIEGENTVVFENVMIGDVWFASGQSNMEWKLKQQVDNFEKEIANARYPQIRLFEVPNRAAPFPKEDLENGGWRECTPETAADFSAVAYFFGRDIHLEKNIPVGLIDCTWGGTTAEAWTSYEKLYTLPFLQSSIREITEKKENWEPDIDPNEKRTAKRAELASNSNQALEKGATKLSYNDFEWSTVMIPEWNKDIGGIIWLRKKIDIPALYKKQDMVLTLGKPGGTVEVYFNENKIGEASGPSNVEFNIPGKIVRSGENQITLRLAHARYNGRLTGKAEHYQIRTSTGAAVADLSGEWKFNNQLEPELPEIKFYYRYPAALFNGMINPIASFGIKGAIWYQGENNAVNARQYYDLFPALIQDWRVRWQQGYFPFIYVQLANYGEPAEEPGESDFALVRDAQLSALKYPNTGMAVTIDIGESYDVHPKNKQDVGKRLALAARKIAYGEKVAWSGPIYRSMTVEGNEIAISFEPYSLEGGGLTAKNGELSGFTIAGKDKRFYRAKATIAGGKVYVSSDQVREPVAVRYGWAGNPKANLYNKQGLPASPFRTDDW